MLLRLLSTALLLLPCLAGSASHALPLPSGTVVTTPEVVIPAKNQNPLPPVEVSFEVVQVLNGTPTGGVTGFGSIAPDDLTLVMQMHVDSSSTVAVDVFSMGVSEAADGEGDIVSGIGLIPGTGVGLSQSPCCAFVGSVGPGQSSDLFYLSWSRLKQPPFPPSTIPDSVEGSVHWLGGQQSYFMGFRLVPEPAVGLLLATGLAVLARRRGA